MLTKQNLRWTYKLFHLYSSLMLIPVTFKPAFLGELASQMESEKASIWRRLGFKVAQIFLICQTLFISFRTLDCMTGVSGFFFGENDGEDVDLDWDFVPIMLCFTVSFLTLNPIIYFIFDVGRELNTKIYNEIFKLRGKKT